jgi:hypothetical protein
MTGEKYHGWICGEKEISTLTATTNGKNSNKYIR